jgi:hypothetical protein
LTIIKDIDIKASTAIKVASPKLDDQVEAEWLPFSGISYEPDDDAIVIVLEGMTV